MVSGYLWNSQKGTFKSAFTIGITIEPPLNDYISLSMSIGQSVILEHENTLGKGESPM